MVQENPLLPVSWIDSSFSGGVAGIYVQQDPPLATGWVDTYFTHNAVDGYLQQDPPLPEGWVDPYFSRTDVIIEQQDPPLLDGWVAPHFSTTDETMLLPIPPERSTLSGRIFVQPIGEQPGLPWGHSPLAAQADRFAHLPDCSA